MPKYLEHVRTLDCVVTGRPGPNDAAHTKAFQYRGTSKPDDFYVLPLCREMHTLQGQMGELRYWRSYIGENDHFLVDCINAYQREKYREWKNANNG